MRRAAKVDSNQSEIERAARKLGCSWLSLAPLGFGAPDALIGHAGPRGRHNLLIEIKPDDRALESAQTKFHLEWRGQVAVVRSVDDLLRLLKRP